MQAMLSKAEFLKALGNPALDVFTVVRLARIDANEGNMVSCIGRLKIDADKLRVHDKSLYETVSSIASGETPWG